MKVKRNVVADKYAARGRRALRAERRSAARLSLAGRGFRRRWDAFGCRGGAVAARPPWRRRCRRPGARGRTGAATHAERRRRHDRRPDPGVAGGDAEVQRSSSAAGATFANSFTNWPLCCPSRATFLHRPVRAQPPRARQPPPDGGFGRLDDSETLPVWLQRAGYHTIHVGKYLNGYGEDSTDPAYVPPGWNEWYAAPAAPPRLRLRSSTRERPARHLRPPTVPTDFEQDVFTDLAVDAINRHAPGGTVLPLRRVHWRPTAAARTRTPSRRRTATPAKPAPRHAARSTRAAPGAAELQRGRRLRQAGRDPRPRPDRPSDVANIHAPLPLPARVAALGRRGRRADRRALCERGELDNTLVVFTSDNGFFPGEHRVRSGKNRVYEEAIRVPLVMRGPGCPTASRSTTSHQRRLAPTILDAADADRRATAGRPLAAAVRRPPRAPATAASS